MGTALATQAGMIVPPISLPFLPVMILVIADVLVVVRCLAPGIAYTGPQAGCYEVVQRGYELLVDQVLFQLCSVIVENLTVKLIS